jgi:hypothetical protein
VGTAVSRSFFSVVALWKKHRRCFLCCDAMPWTGLDGLGPWSLAELSQHLLWLFMSGICQWRRILRWAGAYNFAITLMNSTWFSLNLEDLCNHRKKNLCIPNVKRRIYSSNTFRYLLDFFQTPAYSNTGLAPHTESAPCFRSYCTGEQKSCAATWAPFRFLPRMFIWRFTCVQLPLHPKFHFFSEVGDVGMMR